MIRLADEFFETKNDPEQISGTEDVFRRLGRLHPATLSEKKTRNGPVAWIMVIPTSLEIMEDFLTEWLSEKDLLERAAPGTSFEAIYLCSALVLPEFRRKGLAAQLTLSAVRSIMRDHPVNSLYYWSFSDAGDALARSVATKAGLRLLKRGRRDDHSGDYTAAGITITEH